MVAPRKRLYVFWTYVLMMLAPMAQAFAEETAKAPPPFGPTTLKEWFDLAGGLTAALIAIVGLFRGLRTAEESVKQRKEDHRQRQLAASHDMINEVFSDPLARAAMRMMDWSGRTFTYAGNPYVVHWNELRPALAVAQKGLGFSKQQEFIRDAFEAFFDHMLVLNHFIDREYLNAKDVAVPLKYYAQAIIRYPTTYDEFLQEYGYSEVKVLLAKLANL
ncbi:hypothetical protein ACNFIA_17315 [Pseudomonas sp. NY15437]|uniref:hypothetical protein n=1 Tax=Pseudomonas sp. NY15437 TaxID=3400360 RepID=UPI003A888812